jgi:hypothetical protein
VQSTDFVLGLSLGGRQPNPESVIHDHLQKECAVHFLILSEFYRNKTGYTLEQSTPPGLPIPDKRLPKAANLSMSWNVKKMGGVGDATITAPAGDLLTLFAGLERLTLSQTCIPPLFTSYSERSRPVSETQDRNNARGIIHNLLRLQGCKILPLKQNAKPTTGFAICSPDAPQDVFASDQYGLPGSSLRTSISIVIKSTKSITFGYFKDWKV